MIPLRYNVGSLFVRKSATILTLMAIALSVTVLVIVLALYQGFETSLATTGRPDNLIVMRKTAQSEGVSVLSRSGARDILARGCFATEDNVPLAEAEAYAAFCLEKATGGMSNVTIRGVGDKALRIRDQVRLAEGRMLKFGTLEVVVGKSLIERLKGCRVGGAIKIADRDWPVVGVLDASGTAYDSEMWGDVEVLAAQLNRNGYNVVIGRLAAGQSLAAVKQQIGDDQRIVAKAQSEPEYFASQTGILGEMMKVMAWFFAVVMSVGAVFGAANTLFASVAARTREIGALLAIGFRPFAVFLSFVFESLLLGLLGGIVGVVLAFPVHGISTGTTNWNTFTEQTFRFEISFGVILSGLSLSLVIGLLGGALPALRASRLKPLDALRAL